MAQHLRYLRPSRILLTPLKFLLAELIFCWLIIFVSPTNHLNRPADIADDGPALGLKRSEMFISTRSDEMSSCRVLDVESEAFCAEDFGELIFYIYHSNLFHHAGGNVATIFSKSSCNKFSWRLKSAILSL